MSNGAPSTTYSESVLRSSTPTDFNEPPNGNSQGLSEAAFNQLIEQKIQPIWNALGNSNNRSMKERAEMQLKIEALESSERNLKIQNYELKNQVENVTFNNAELVERVENVEMENAQLKQMITEMEISGKIKHLKTKSERKNDERKIERKNDELEKMRTELGDIGGAGHFFGNDKEMENGGVRNWMEGNKLKKVAEAGWTTKFKTARKNYGGDGKYSYLWISNKEGGVKFKATAQEINCLNGEETNRRELQSEKDGTRQRIKYEMVAGYLFVRFNITIL
ncbi:unnamed protein product [Oikopleura dioica]|uniref:Uncharacterized protein n=1 Tax=Oikopleura dioica TaxID=34765 RepID=E4Y901_OIKDI|nr:unnamed protein product [Oikopleura dioica]